MANNSRLFFIVIIFVFSLFARGVYAQVSIDVSVSAQVGTTAPAPAGGGSQGGGGVVSLPQTSVRFSGVAYPFSSVSILEDGAEKSKVTADDFGNFSITFAEEFDSNILYSLFANDPKGVRSILLNYPLVVKEGYLTQVSGVRFPPTISTDKSEVKQGDFLSIYGYAYSGAGVEVYVEGGLVPQRGLGISKVLNTQADTEGNYKIVVPLAGMSKGEYVVYAKYKDDERISKLVRFVVGESNILTKDMVMNLPGDCNNDDVINLIDFSVLAYWYQRNNPPQCVDLNKDNIINLTDFSILAFYWTG